VSTGDTCLSIVFGNRIDADVNAHCVSIAAALAAERREGIRDVVPTFNAVAVHFDSVRLDRKVLETDLLRLAALPDSTAAIDPAPIEIPVAYGGEAGPDLNDVAAFGGCSEGEVVVRHTSVVYRVYMLGFLPGFAYMATVDPRIAAPRLATPRARVAAGSVGIAGSQTGVYPCETPGGWRIIGKTSAQLVDTSRSNPFLLKAGDRVKFVAA
jgi:KipI family sensor histidine kinase inhibitor